MTLIMNITREVKPTEITGLVFGTGALTSGWWQRARMLREEPDGQGAFMLVDRGADWDWPDLLETDVLELTVDDPDYAEGDAVPLTKRFAMNEVVAMASRLLAEDRLDDESARDMRTEDLGYADALAADCILQYLMFGEAVYG